MAYRSPSFKPFKVKVVKTYSYLNMIGRPTVYLHFKNHNGLISPKAKIYIQYTFNSTWLYVSPAYLSGGLMTLFLFYLIWSRINFSFGIEEEIATAKPRAKPAAASK